MTAKYQCKDGYYFGNDNQDVECEIDGKWRETPVLCYPYCTAPSDSDNGNLKVSSIFIVVLMHTIQKYLINSYRKVG
ncbi:hypothetical protein DPMN_184866 [Dreissena polymorpha]|uniref:Sushi domain-containing protein n=1 Tax=Dreissena polymorpha TaxID=45954 RepID=A0A9D4DKT9_DREPO|nr:hypothetical protein DPMN_184866 [Dreissena polymorpha]